MEIFTGKPKSSIRMPLAKAYLSAYVTEMTDKRINSLVDPRLKLNINEIERARELLHLVVEFTNNEKTMEEVLKELEQFYSRMTSTMPVLSICSRSLIIFCIFLNRY